jgi:hypothetical protein
VCNQKGNHYTNITNRRWNGLCFCRTNCGHFVLLYRTRLLCVERQRAREVLPKITTCKWYNGMNELLYRYNDWFTSNVKIFFSFM